VVYEEKDIQSRGEHRLTLPADLEVKPGNALFLEVAASRDGLPASFRTERLVLDQPTYVTHLATDKPMYRPGEVVAFRSMTLERFSLKPAEEELRLIYTMTNAQGETIFRLAGPARLADAQHNPLLGPDNLPIRGIGAGEFPIPPDAKGGEYTLTVREAANRFPPQERRFVVNQYEKPRLNKELEFTRRSYGPGDEVTAACRVARAEGGLPVADQPVTATVQVDGKRFNA